MGDLPLPVSSVPGLLSRAADPLPIGLAQATPTQPSDNLALLGVLRQALAAGTQSTDSILTAVADAARVLTAANGTAIAMRMDGVIVCRARSGEIAPQLGAPLNTDSGISGECLRTATIMVCRDATTDDRVNPEVCRSLGIRSVVVVPLRGRIGMLGILEAFSERPGAFGEEQINSLRALAEIAEAAYERERRATITALGAGTSPTSRPALFAAPAGADQNPGSEISEQRSPTKRYWLIGAAAILLTLTAIVVRLSWRQTGAEIAASEPSSQPLSISGDASSNAPARVVPLKPGAAVTVRQPDRPRTNLLQNAADIESATDKPESPSSIKNPASRDASEKAAARPSPANFASEPPPSIEVAASTTPDELVRLAAGSAPLPAFGAKISQGAIEPKLIQKVDPIYPPKARIQGLTGSVTLDATIAEDGSIRAVAVVSGTSLLADAAATAIRQWRYRPATLNGKPVETQKRITVVFKLP